jgi:hypothetical protein
MKRYLSPKHRRQSKVSWKRRVATFGNNKLREVDLLEVFEAYGCKRGLKWLFDFAEQTQKGQNHPSNRPPTRLEFRYLNEAESQSALARKARSERSRK